MLKYLRILLLLLLEKSLCFKLVNVAEKGLSNGAVQTTLFLGFQALSSKFYLRNCNQVFKLSIERNYINIT